jgi:hypothetical protein
MGISQPVESNFDATKHRKTNSEFRNNIQYDPEMRRMTAPQTMRGLPEGRGTSYRVQGDDS